MEAILILAIVLVVILLCGLLFKAYVLCTAGHCNSDVSMSGKTVLITGANAGIGLETARELARRGARVIMACRSFERGQDAAQDICQSTNSLHVRVMQCDTSSMASIRAFCREYLRTESRLDVLVLNAGMVPPPGKYLTEEGNELQFATNHLGPFLLTNLLLEKLKQCSPSRIVVVSSSLHSFCQQIDFANMNFEKHTPDPFFTYCKSKLANVLFVKELERRLEGTEVTANALHPGLVRTKINRQTPWYLKNFLQPFLYLWAKDVVKGAQTTIHLCVADEVKTVTGKYFVDCKPARHSSKCNDEQLAAELWRWSERASGLKENV